MLVVKQIWIDLLTLPGISAPFGVLHRTLHIDCL